MGTTPCFAFDYQPGTNACYLNTHCDNSEIDRQQRSISCKRQTNAQTDNHCTSNNSGGVIVMDSSLASPNFTSLKAFCKAQRGPISTDDVNENLVLIVPILLLIAQAWCAPRSFPVVSQRLQGCLDGIRIAVLVFLRALVFLSHIVLFVSHCVWAPCVSNAAPSVGVL